MSESPPLPAPSPPARAFTITCVRLAVLALIAGAVVCALFVATFPVRLPGGGGGVERLTLVECLARPGGRGALIALVRQTVADLGPWGPALFAAAYVAAAVVALPPTILTVAGAPVFGFWVTLAGATVGSNAGAAAAFFAARFVARDAVERRLPAKLRTWDAKLEERGFATTLLLRLIPAVPYGVVSYVCGLSRMRYRNYAAGTLLGMLPGACLWILGSLAFARLSWRHPLAWAPLGGLLLLMGLMRLAKGRGKNDQLPKDQ